MKYRKLRIVVDGGALVFGKLISYLCYGDLHLIRKKGQMDGRGVLSAALLKMSTAPTRKNTRKNPHGWFILWKEF